MQIDKDSLPCMMNEWQSNLLFWVVVMVIGVKLLVVLINLVQVELKFCISLCKHTVDVICLFYKITKISSRKETLNNNYCFCTSVVFKLNFLRAH